MSGQWTTLIQPFMTRLDELLRPSVLINHAAGHQIMLQMPDRKKVWAPDPPPSLVDDWAAASANPALGGLKAVMAYAIELHLMISVIPALELPPYADGTNDPF
jgi:hypothetical protein